MATNESGGSRGVADLLPQDFFDSDKRSKKVKDDELVRELEQFEKEMAALEAESEEQMQEEFDRLQEEKNMDELEQQLEQWKRMVELEKKAEELRNKVVSESACKKMKLGDGQDGPAKNELADEDLDGIEDFEDELSNWRSKGI